MTNRFIIKRVASFRPPKLFLIKGYSRFYGLISLCILLIVVVGPWIIFEEVCRLLFFPKISRRQAMRALVSKIKKGFTETPSGLRQEFNRIFKYNNSWVLFFVRNGNFHPYEQANYPIAVVPSYSDARNCLKTFKNFPNEELAYEWQSMRYILKENGWLWLTQVKIK